jgi:ribosomal-protein-alanine N-acetyltransferase
VTEEIQTPRLVLRPVSLEDLDDYVALYADPEVVRFLGDGTTAGPAESRTWVGQAIDRNERQGWDLRTVRLHDGTFVGRCGIAVRDLDGVTEHEVAYALAREHWGHGYATEAATAVRDHAIGDRGRSRLICLVAHGNTASRRVATKLGMSYERDVEFHGRPCGLFVMVP